MDAVSVEVFALLAGVAAFALGATPFGAILARLRGVDIQTVGSGNIGATNVARNLGKKLGALVLLLDAGKGALAVVLVGAAAQRWGTSFVPTDEVAMFARKAAAAAGLAAVLGHCFTPWLKFRGGKGVATALGVFVVLDPLASLISVVLFGVVYAAFRVASVGSLTAALLFPAILWWRGHGRWTVVIAGMIALLIVIRHRDNLQRLRGGREHKV